MRLVSVYSVMLLLLACGLCATAQVTNLTVNGSTTNFTMISGDAVSWEYDVPAAATASVEIWFDLNENGAIDPGTDKLFAEFPQTDGQPFGDHGPPDMDGLANGHVTFSQPVGLAPSMYVLRATHDAVGQSVAGTVTPLASPNATISGAVTPPPGKSKANIVVEANQRRDSTGQQEGDDMFWDALTDSNGFYTINIHVDTTTTYWRVSVMDNFAPSVSAPLDTTLTLHTSATGIDFAFVAAAAQVTGHVIDQTFSPVSFTDVFLSTDTGNTYIGGRTDASGNFVIGLPPGALDGSAWRVQTSQQGRYTTGTLQARADLGVLIPGDSLYRVLTVYTTNSQIEGYVRIDGLAPGYPMDVAALSGDSVQATALVDSVSGYFMIPVSDQLADYQLYVWPMPSNSSMNPVTAQPGDTGKIINIITTSVIERGNGMPGTFALHQNYPNPFNPATGIRYDLPGAAHVTLAVYDMLGREVATLMDGEQQAGSYTARFDASSLPSGVYFTRLTAGKQVATQKMLLMK